MARSFGGDLTLVEVTIDSVDSEFGQRLWIAAAGPLIRNSPR